MAAHGIEGVVQIQGVFMDTASGLVGSPGEKKWLEAYPVIVMEFLDGGSIYDVIHEREKISEADLKRIYAGFIAALASMHTHGYIHNDLKLENIMLESQTDDSGVKIIDLGFMNYLANGASKITHSGVKGTPGYIAPETLSRHEYSYKTDMWQAGCVLYSMLSGVGDCWDAISESAKDLVYKLLVLSPARRLGTQEVLQHPWITGQAPDVHLGDEYVARVKHLALRQKMRKFFLQNDILEKNKIRTDHIQR
ncbi:CPK13, partial [Symbiodinium microadriaticum]